MSPYSTAQALLNRRTGRTILLFCMARNNRQGRGRGRQRSRRPRRPVLDPIKHPLPAARPERDYDDCAVSGEPMDDIVCALAEPDSGKPARFESVLTELAAKFTLKSDERFVYLGRGAFGIVAMEKVEGRNRLVVREKVQYEDHHEKYAWRRELAPGISRDYTPEPDPITELYTSEEISQFPRFRAVTGGH